MRLRKHSLTRPWCRKIRVGPCAGDERVSCKTKEENSSNIAAMLNDQRYKGSCTLGSDF